MVYPKSKVEGILVSFSNTAAAVASSFEAKSAWCECLHDYRLDIATLCFPTMVLTGLNTNSPMMIETSVLVFLNIPEQFQGSVYHGRDDHDLATEAGHWQAVHFHKPGFTEACWTVFRTMMKMCGCGMVLHNSLVSHGRQLDQPKTNVYHLCGRELY